MQASGRLRLKKDRVKACLSESEGVTVRLFRTGLEADTEARKSLSNLEWALEPFEGTSNFESNFEPLRSSLSNLEDLRASSFHHGLRVNHPLVNLWTLSSACKCFRTASSRSKRSSLLRSVTDARASSRQRFARFLPRSGHQRRRR